MNFRNSSFISLISGIKTSVLAVVINFPIVFIYLIELIEISLFEFEYDEFSSSS